MYLFTDLSRATPELIAAVTDLIDAHGLDVVLEATVLACGQKADAQADVDVANATWVASGRAIASLRIGDHR